MFTSNSYTLYIALGRAEAWSVSASAMLGAAAAGAWAPDLCRGHAKWTIYMLRAERIQVPKVQIGLQLLWLPSPDMIFSSFVKNVYSNVHMQKYVHWFSAIAIYVYIYIYVRRFVHWPCLWNDFSTDQVQLLCLWNRLFSDQLRWLCFWNDLSTDQLQLLFT